MESERIFSDPEKIDHYFAELEALLEFCIFPEFIINIDESGYQELADARISSQKWERKEHGSIMME